jgi:hypothetical protein
LAFDREMLCWISMVQGLRFFHMIPLALNGLRDSVRDRSLGPFLRFFSKKQLSIKKPPFPPSPTVPCGDGSPPKTQPD